MDMASKLFTFTFYIYTARAHMMRGARIQQPRHLRQCRYAGASTLTVRMRSDGRMDTISGMMPGLVPAPAPPVARAASRSSAVDGALHSFKAGWDGPWLPAWGFRIRQGTVADTTSTTSHNAALRTGIAQRERS